MFARVPKEQKGVENSVNSHRFRKILLRFAHRQQVAGVTRTGCNNVDWGLAGKGFFVLRFFEKMPIKK